MNKFQVIPFELRSLRSFTDSFPINVPKSTRHGLNPFFIQPWCHWNRFTEFYRVFVLWLSARHTRSIRYGGDEQNGNSSPSNWGHYLKGHWGLTSGREPNWKRNMWRSRKKVEERGVESEEEEQQHRKKYQTKLPFFFHPLLSAAFGIQVYHFRGLFLSFGREIGSALPSTGHQLVASAATDPLQSIGVCKSMDDRMRREIEQKKKKKRIWRPPLMRVCLLPAFFCVLCCSCLL